MALAAFAGRPSTAAASCDSLFAAEAPHAAGVNPRGIVVRDFSADGIPDIAVANAGGSVTVHLRRAGTGTFAPAVSYAVPGEPFGIASADLNGDGIADLVTANRVAGTISVLLGGGTPGPADGTFVPRASYPAGPLPYFVTARDFNADQITDLAVVNNGCPGGGISILIGRGAGGRGDGSFDPPVAYPLGCNPSAIAVGDFDADGILDLAVALYTPRQIAILPGLGTGGAGSGAFGPPSYVGTILYPYDIQCADFNADGVLDLAIAGNGGLATMPGQGAAGAGDGTFGSQTQILSPAQTALGIADFDGDHVADIAVVSAPGNACRILRGLTTDGVADGRFALAFQKPVVNGPIAVGVGDFDADGLPDVGIANYFSNSLATFLAIRHENPVADRDGWADGGVALCTASNAQQGPRGVADGVGGAIVAWQDFRDGGGDIFAQRVSRTGRILWAAEGIPICPDSADRWGPQLAEDGRGGAWIAWEQYDLNNPASLRVQRLTPAGTPADGFPCPGRLVSDPTFELSRYALAADGEGGVFVIYAAYGPPTNAEKLYCQRLNAEGDPAQGWPAGGVVVNDGVVPPPGFGVVEFQLPELSVDPGGGAVVTWRTSIEYGCGPGFPETCGTVYVGTARVTPGGAVSFSDAFRFPEEVFSHVVPAGGGGQILVTSIPDGNILGRRLGPTGKVEWTTLITANASKHIPVLAIPCDGGGVTTVWLDYRSANVDLFAGRLSGDGTTALGWPDQGASICSEPHNQAMPVAVPDEEQGLTLCWEDWRSGSSDVYATQLDSDGAPRPGWLEGGAPVCLVASLSRQSPALIGSGSSGAIAVWQEDRCGGWDIYAKRIPLGGLVTVHPEGPQHQRLDLEGARPNPARGIVRAAFTLPDARPAALELFDIAGRRVLSRDVGSLGAGSHMLGLRPAAPLVPGLYLLRLRTADHALSRRVIVTR